MRRPRWIIRSENYQKKPVIYHLFNRVVERRFALGDVEREQFRIFMRMYENFSGCRILSYCIVSNHFHILLEVPPMPEGGLSDEGLLSRLSAIYGENVVQDVANELKDARGKSLAARVAEIHARYTYRMHNLSEFMKWVMQRMTQWYNRENQRTGTLWESRFTSVIVESGTAARMMAAYIDLNPVRAGMVSDPAEYRWSSYGEAIGGRVKGSSLTRSGAKGNGRVKGMHLTRFAREGLVRACMAHKGVGFEAEKWYDVAKIYRKLLGMALERKAGAAASEVATVKGKRHQARVGNSMKGATSRKRLMPHAIADEKGAPTEDENDTVLPEMKMAEMLCHRVRYFTAGAVIGSKAFVNEAFTRARARFSEKRKDGARRMRGNAESAKGLLWSMRDLQV